MLRRHIKEFVANTLHKGGCTMSVVGNKPADGYMVSVYRTCERQYPELYFNISNVVDYCRQYETELYEHDNTFLGSWTNNNTIFLDVSVNVSSLEWAIELAKEYNQLAVWDVLNQEEILVE